MTSPMLAGALAGNILGSEDNSFVVAEWHDAGSPPGPPRCIAPWHLHRQDDEAWYVLEGTLIVHRGLELIEARAGTAVLVPAGTPHTYWNPNPGPARYLLIMTPKIHSLIRAIHATSDRSLATMRAIFENHDSELLDPSADK